MHNYDSIIEGCTKVNARPKVHVSLIYLFFSLKKEKRSPSVAKKVTRHARSFLCYIHDDGPHLTEIVAPHHEGKLVPISSDIEPQLSRRRADLQRTLEGAQMHVQFAFQSRCKSPSHHSRARIGWLDGTECGIAPSFFACARKSAFFPENGC